MANTRAGSCILVDTNAAFTEVRRIKAIKYIGNTSGTAVITSGSSSGNRLWEESGASNAFNEVEINCADGIYVTLTNSAKVYLYV